MALPPETVKRHAKLTPRMPASYVKAYVKRNKNDAADAAAICEEVTRPSMRFVPIKTAEQQSALMLHRTRDLLVRHNETRWQLAEKVEHFAASELLFEYRFLGTIDAM